MGAETAEREPRDLPERIFLGPYGVRAGWRIILYAVFVAALSMAGGVVLGALGLLQSVTATTVLLLAAAVVAGWGMLAFVDHRPIGALGFAAEPAAVRDSAVGFAFGGGMLGLAVIMLAVAGTARWVADDGTTTDYVAVLAGSFAFFAVAAAMEEALFRGYAFQALVQGIGAWPAAVLTSALFALGHAGNPNADLVGLANIFLAGVMLAACYLRTRSLWFATAVHLGWNWVMSALLDFPVSGLVRDTPLYSARETGADWWTGGPFGPEAGVAATAVIALGTLWLLRTRAVGESPRMRELRPLVDDRLKERWP